MADDKTQKKFDFKEFIEEAAVEDRKKAMNNIKKEWRDLMLDNPTNKKEGKDKK